MTYFDVYRVKKLHSQVHEAFSTFTYVSNSLVETGKKENSTSVSVSDRPVYIY